MKKNTEWGVDIAMNKITPIFRKLMCSLGYHRYHPSAMEMKYIRNEGRYWVYEVTMQCAYCDKPRNDIISIPKPVKEGRDG